MKLYLDEYGGYLESRIELSNTHMSYDDYTELYKGKK